MEHLPDEIAKQMAAEVINRASRHPDGTITALSGLVTILDARFGPDHQATLNALSCQANISHDLGDQERRVESIRRVLASHDRQGRAEDALTTACGLALAARRRGRYDRRCGRTSRRRPWRTASTARNCPVCYYVTGAGAGGGRPAGRGGAAPAGSSSSARSRI